MQINVCLEAFKLLCRSVDSPYSRAALVATLADPLSAGRLTIDPGEYHDAELFRKDYLIYSYLRKYTGGADDTTLSKRARAVFRETDSLCLETNNRLRSTTLSPLIGNGVSVQSVLMLAREKIGQILGDCSPSKWVEHCEWGPGATSTIGAEDATVDKKVLESTLSVTGSALKYATAYVQTDLSWSSARLRVPCEGPVSSLDPWFEICDDGRYSCVDKDTRSKRSIDIQPTMNLFLQKGVGKYIRKRLKRFGVDLDDQSRNQYLASVAQDWRLATIDLSQASDTIARELVRTLLSDEWFTLLNDLRTKSISIDGTPWRLEKFSAMGNGFTFELESLIFWALAWSTQTALEHGGPIGVYGDDIIISQLSAPPLVAVLEYCGFTVNLEKSFLTGRFYESCGKHYFDGVDVTPIYQKEVVIDLHSLVRAHNRLVRWGLRGDRDFWWCGSVIRPAVSLYRQLSRTYTGQFGFRYTLFKAAPHGVRDEVTHVRADVPSQPWWYEGDVGLIRFLDFPRDVNGIVRLKGLRIQPRKRRGDEYALYATSLRRGVVVENPYLGFVNPRGGGKTSLATFRAYGPWNEGAVPTWL